MPAEGVDELLSARPGPDDWESLMALLGLLETGDTVRGDQH